MSRAGRVSPETHRKRWRKHRDRIQSQSSQRKGSSHDSRIKIRVHRVLMLCLATALWARSGHERRAQESWDAIYLAGTKVGYVHTYVEKVKNQGSEYLRVRIDMEQRIKRGRDFSVTRLTYGTIETLDGQVLRLDTLDRCRRAADPHAWRRDHAAR